MEMGVEMDLELEVEKQLIKSNIYYDILTFIMSCSNSVSRGSNL